MKQIMALTLAGFMLAFLGMALPAVADTNKIIKVNIPFEFTFGDQTFPAGEYSLTQPLENVVSLRNERGQVLGSVLTDGVDARTTAAVTKLRFTSVSGQHILSEVWRGEETRGQQLLQAKEHTRLAERKAGEFHGTDNGGQP